MSTNFQLSTLPSPVDGLPLSVMWKAPDHPRAIVQIVHGMCEHKERYLDFMDYLVSQGFATIIHDHRGHGASVRSADDLGYMYDGGWEALIEDVKAVHDWTKTRYPDLRYILFGHSMGSLVVRSYTKRYDDTIDELFVCGSPSYNPASIIAKYACRLLMACGAGHYRPSIIQSLAFDSFNRPFAHEGYHSAWVCSDKAILEQYHHDPLCQYIFTANGFYNLFRLMQDCYSTQGWQHRNPQLPVHFISGAQDPCRISDTHFHTSVTQLTALYPTDSKLFAGMRHEVLNETRRHEVYEYVVGKIGLVEAWSK